LPRSEAQGTQTIGSPFSLLTFFLATQKESKLPPGNPRLAERPTNAQACTGVDKLNPNGAPKRY
jgi:hypothetical protein